MIIYTGTARGKKLDSLVSRDMGIMISPSPTFPPQKDYSRTRCALDNGAFQCWRRGFPFMEKYFWETMEKCYEVGLKLDFIVIPDIVAGGKKSLDFSTKFKDEKLSTTANLALAVQDGIEPKDIDQYCLLNVSHIFVGGTERWKWKTAKDWAVFAKSEHRKLHIGRCGTKDKMSHASLVGADSVDSVSFARNESWEIVDNFRSQLELRGLGEEKCLPPCIVNGVIE